MRDTASFRRSTFATANDQMLMASFLVALFVAGSSFALIALAVPHAEDMNELGVAAAAAAAYVVAGILYILRRRLQGWGFDVAVAAGTCLISTGVYFSGSATTTFAFFYLWVVLYSAYFFSRWRSGLQLSLVAIGYATVLALKPSTPGAVESWIVLVGTLAMAAVLFIVVRDRVTSLVERLAAAADTDPLTELLNRRGFATEFERELERAQRSGTPFSLVAADLDHFKQINDHFGHQAGDEVLKVVADLLRKQARLNDTAARVGGEEFALLLPSTHAQDAFVFAERIRHRIPEALPERYSWLTLSFGISAYPGDGESVERLLRCADESLYAAKTLGRNRSVIYSEEVIAVLSSAPQSASNLTTLLTLAEALDIRDPRTARHSATVARLAETMARELELSEARVERIRLAAFLHDIGKIGISDSVLQKAGPLDESEWAEIHKHPEIGARLLSAHELGDLRAWVLAHHERIEGGGYPHGLRGEEIPLEARIIAVADAFEAMLADRVYRTGMTVEAAVAELTRTSGTQFDERVVSALVGSLGSTLGGIRPVSPA